MKIDRILNNNVVITVDENLQEMVVMGKGIGFNKKAGENINPTHIEKTFSPDTSYSDHFRSLLDQVSKECILATEAIISLARGRLPGKLHDSLLISLVDHLHYALQRFSENISIQNGLLWEIKKVYPHEYDVGKDALQIIYQHTGTLLPEDEAGFIALHLVNAQLNDNMQNTMKITRFIQDILSLVAYHFDITYQEKALSYQRFVTHLKFFAQRILDKKHLDIGDPDLATLVKGKYKDAYACAIKISKYSELHHDHTLTMDELMFLAIHIEQVKIAISTEDK